MAKSWRVSFFEPLSEAIIQIQIADEDEFFAVNRAKSLLVAPDREFVWLATEELSNG